jgi:hypothetical protein
LAALNFGPGTLHDAQGRLLGHVAASPPDVSDQPAFPADNPIVGIALAIPVQWGTIICAWVPFDRRGPRSTPKEIRRFRYVRQFHRRRLRSWGADTGLWFHGILVVHFDREPAKPREASV